MEDKKYINLEWSELYTTNMLLIYIESKLEKIKSVSKEDIKCIKDNLRRSARLADEYKNLIKAKNLNK